MATFSKYKLYELYETDDGINWFPMGEYKAVLSEMYSEDCGYSARTITETIDDCSGTTKVITNITKYQESYDSGSTWVTTSSTSSVTYEENSPDCGYSPDLSNKYLTFVANSNGTINYSGTSVTNKLSYSNDNGLSWSSPSYLVSFNVNSGDTILFKGNMIPTNNSSSNSYGIGTFSGSTASFDVQGNIMSLLYGDNFIGQTDLTNKKYAFSNLFRNTRVISAENLVLPATTLADRCYEYMFYSCLRLTTAPQLPATTLAYQCYRGMFQGCTSFTTAPQLLATTLAYGCYETMFRDCTSLTIAPDLLSTTLASRCYTSMFYGCSSLNYIKMLATDISATDCLASWVGGVAASGTFVKAASMTNLPSGNSGIPNNWTVQNA